MKILYLIPDKLSFLIIKHITAKMINKNIKKYLYIFENLNLANLNKLKTLIDKNVYFEDPFNKTYGDKKIYKNFQKITF